jgi:hypothetical protein
MDVFLEQQPDWAQRSLVSRIAVSHPLRALTADELLSEAEQLPGRGVRYVSIRRQQVQQIDAGRVQHILADVGVSVSSLGYCGGFTGSLGMSFEQAQEDTARAVDMALEIGARSLIVLPGCQNLHTYRHAEQSIRMGLQSAISHAGQVQLNLLVPTSSLLGNHSDNFRSREGMLDWLETSTSHRVQPLIVVRGKNRTCRLPSGWRKSLSGGGMLRLCQMCRNYERNSRVLNRLLRILTLKHAQTSDLSITVD